jgi:hypothetical protein
LPRHRGNIPGPSLVIMFSGSARGTPPFPRKYIWGLKKPQFPMARYPVAPPTHHKPVPFSHRPRLAPFYPFYPFFASRRSRHGLIHLHKSFLAPVASLLFLTLLYPRFLNGFTCRTFVFSSTTPRANYITTSSLRPDIRGLYKFDV